MASEDSRVRITAAVPPGTALRIEVEATLPGEGSATRKKLLLPGSEAPDQARSAIVGRLSLESWLFVLALAVYLAVRLIGLEDFPIYFFADEAVQTVMAEHFAHTGANYAGELWPTYFQPDPTYNQSSITVYQQVIPYLLFGKSVFVTRVVSVLVGGIAALAVGLSLRQVFRVRYWWAGVLMLSLIPAWFLHSRTAFEPVTTTGLYAGFIYFYLLYRVRAPVYLYPALILGALTFYTYGPAQFLVPVTGLCLLLSDWRYHWQNRRTVLVGAVLLIILALPYVHYQLDHPSGAYATLARRGFYWIKDIPLSEKLRRAVTEYLMGINPYFWFWPQEGTVQASVRHCLKGYGHLGWVTLPCLLIGLGLTVWRGREAPYRILLIALFTCPLIGVLAGAGIARLLVMIFPAALIAALGLAAAVEFLERRLSACRRSLLAGSIFVVLGAVNGYMLWDVLTNGPLWFRDYGLNGMQYGARQVFGALNDYWKQAPGNNVIMAPGWANGTDIIARFFLPPEAPFSMGTIYNYIGNYDPIPPDTLFVFPPDEYQAAIGSDLVTVEVERTLNYPDGNPGFYFVRLAYRVEDIETLREAEHLRRRQPVTEETVVDGEVVAVTHSVYDIGEIASAFDGVPVSVARTWEANPSLFALAFPRGRAVRGLELVIDGGIDRLVAQMVENESERTYIFTRPSDGPEFTVTENAPVRVATEGVFQGRRMIIDWGMELRLSKLRLEFWRSDCVEPCKLHVFEITLK